MDDRCIECACCKADEADNLSPAVQTRFDRDMDESRMIQEENSVDSEDEARRHDYGLYLMKRLIQIKKGQVNRVRLETLLRAFYRWSYEFPLAQKCDELAKQLRERNLMLDTVRSSYLRDVVSVKHHLDKINDAEVDEENPSLVKLKQNMYDLHTVPSVDLRSLVENARASVQQNSAQLRDGLVDAGLLDPETLRTLNPWDQSRGYRRLMRIKKGGAAKPPDVVGESIALAAPSNKKLFVRYCRECIGLAVFIKDWNREVELSMKFKADFCNIDNLVQEYRSVIDKLNGTIEHQEKEIVRLLERTGKLETANAWFEKWGFMKEAGNTGKGGVLDEYEQKMMYKHTSEMARAEIESFAFNSALRLEAKEQQHLSIELAHRQKLREAELSRDADSKERVKLVQEFRKTQQELQARCNEIADLTQATAVKEAEKTHLQQKLAASEADNRHLHEVIDKKEADYATLRDDSNAKIEDLNFQIKQLNDDYSNQENIIDELRDSLANKKATILDQTNEISELKQRVRELEALIPPPKPRFTLRVVAIAVRYLMRLHRLLRHKDFEAMGRLGFNELTRRQDRYIKMLTNANEKLQRQVFSLTQSLGFQGEELRSYRMVLRDRDIALQEQDEVKLELKRTLSLLRHTERDKLEALALGASNIEAQNVIINQRVNVALDVQHDHHIRQAKVYAQIQRNLGHHLAESLFRVRAIVTSLDIDSDLPKLAKPYEASLPPMVPVDTSPNKRKSPSGSYSAPLYSDFSAKGGGSFHSVASGPPDILTSGRKNTKSLMLNLRTRAKALVSWIRKNRRRMTLMPKKVPVMLFRQPRPEDDKEALRRERVKSLSVMTHVIQHDFHHVEVVRREVDADMRRLQDYVLALKNKHNELLLQVKLLEEELREERMPSVNSRTSRKRIGDIKSSFSHLMHSTHPDHNSSYFSKVLEAIETVQAEHGELYKDKLIKSGKFKLTEVAMEVVNEVRRNSLSLSAREAAPAVAVWSRQNSATKSAKMGGSGTSTKSVRLDPAAVVLDGSPSRGASFTAAGYPMTKLPSVAELDHEAVGPARTPGQGALPRPASHSFRAAALSTKNGVKVPHAVPEGPEEPHLDDDGHSVRSTPEQGVGAVGQPSADNDAQNAAQPTRRRLFADEANADGDGAHAPSLVKPLRAAHPSGSPNRIASTTCAQPGAGLATSVPYQDSDSDKIGFPSRDASVANLGSQPTDRQISERPLPVANPLALSTPAAGPERIARAPRSSEDPAGDQPGFAPDTERSLRYEGERVPAVDPPAPSYGGQGQEDTVGFEADDQDDVSVSQEEEFDEDILYMEDLLAAKFEMQGLLTREEVIQNRIKQAEEDRVQLEHQVRTLEEKLEKKKQEYVQLEQNMYVSAGEQQQLKAEMKELAHQNDLLKEIVEEDYRFHTAHMDKLLREKEDEVLRRLQRKIETAHQSTQVSCAVCAIKEEAMARGGVVPQVHGGYDDSTVAMVNEQFTKALNGEVVLTARPRRINKKSARSNQTESPENVPGIAPHLRGFEELLANPPTKEELLKAAKPLMGCAFDAQLPPKGRLGDRSREREPSPTPASTAMGFSELLMKHLESSHQERNRPASAVAVADGTKFSRIKKMPAKMSTSSGDLLASGAERGNPAPRPHSASLAALKRNSDQRTESHTAAFLQNRLMMTGHGSTPQIAPGYSQAHVPLHTVDLACNAPEPMEEYLARATLNRTRASSASAARTEHTNSGKLLQGWQGMSDVGNYPGKGGGTADPSVLAIGGPPGVPPRPQSVDVRVRVPLPSKRVPDSASPKPAGARREFLLDMADDLSDAGVEFV